MSNIQSVKQRFSIIGDSPELDRAIDVALQVASTDLSVLIAGESGVGKEFFPQIIHTNSNRKHGPYIAVNCGAIPEGTIDSELFGHEKGAFTGAFADRKGYFEVANGGTIFLDEVGELPLSTQARLLRVLESGDFIRVGSSKIQKTDVRIVAATNVDLVEAVRKNKFREDLFYRLNTVPVKIPPLRERKTDIYRIFRKFAFDFSEKYKMPMIQLSEEAKKILLLYRWPGNIRQLKNIVEQISIIEKEREINADVMKSYLPDYISDKTPALYNPSSEEKKSFNNEREILYNVLFDMRKDMNDLKKLVNDIIAGKDLDKVKIKNSDIDVNFSRIEEDLKTNDSNKLVKYNNPSTEYVEETCSLADIEKKAIIKALDRNHGKRRNAAADLNISERTLYRKIKEYDL